MWFNESISLSLSLSSCLLKSNHNQVIYVVLSVPGDGEFFCCPHALCLKHMHKNSGWWNNSVLPVSSWWGMQPGPWDCNASLFGCCLPVLLNAGWCCRGDTSGGNPCRLFELWRDGRRGSAGCFQKRSVTRNRSFCWIWLGGEWTEEGVTPAPHPHSLPFPRSSTPHPPPYPGPLLACKHHSFVHSLTGRTLVKRLTAQNEWLLTPPCSH